MHRLQLVRRVRLICTSMRAYRVGAILPATPNLVDFLSARGISNSREQRSASWQTREVKRCARRKELQPANRERNNLERHGAKTSAQVAAAVAFVFSCLLSALSRCFSLLHCFLSPLRCQAAFAARYLAALSLSKPLLALTYSHGLCGCVLSSH